MNSANRPRIIPFPGVSFVQGNSFQNSSDAGYIEDETAPEVRGKPQSVSLKNEIDDFLREMGYIE